MGLGKEFLVAGVYLALGELVLRFCHLALVISLSFLWCETPILLVHRQHRCSLYVPWSVSLPCLLGRCRYLKPSSPRLPELKRIFLIRIPWFVLGRTATEPHRSVPSRNLKSPLMRLNRMLTQYSTFVTGLSLLIYKVVVEK